MVANLEWNSCSVLSAIGLWGTFGYSIGLCIVSLVEMEVANNNEAFSGFNAVVFVGDDVLGNF